MHKQYPYFSVVVPVYNRPEEIEELLHSLVTQTEKDFEVIIIEDGSTRTSEEVAQRYVNEFPLRYHRKDNSGPGPSRNVGFSMAQGDYLVVFDSDCIIPPHYFEVVRKALIDRKLDAWGGPDRASASFTPVQQAMGLTMSSVLTTGGIRGGKKHLGWFQPRSFNMGISQAVYKQTGGFRFDRYAEDIEFSIRMKVAGFNVGLIPEAFVYHKRRTSFSQFFKQVYNFGKGRALIGAVYPREVKLTHWFPSFFTAAFFFQFVLLFIDARLFVLSISSFALYFFLIFLDAFRTHRSFYVALLAMPAASIQLTGYGLGFFTEVLKSYIKKS